MTKEQYKKLKKWYFKNEYPLIKCVELFRAEYGKGIGYNTIEKAFKEKGLSIRTKTVNKTSSQHKKDFNKGNTFIIEQYKKLKKSLDGVTDLSVRAELVIEYNYKLGLK